MSTAAKRILVCDDDPVILRLLQVNLELENYEVLLAHHGARAVEIATKEHPDLVVLDIMMPRMDGYEACQKLKAHESTKDIPVIFLSARSRDETVEAVQDPRLRYLTKPFDTSELVETVRSLIEEAP